jgi:hypothetical protein
VALDLGQLSFGDSEAGVDGAQFIDGDQHGFIGLDHVAAVDRQDSQSTANGSGDRTVSQLLAGIIQCSLIGSQVGGGGFGLRSVPFGLFLGDYPVLDKL